MTEELTKDYAVLTSESIVLLLITLANMCVFLFTAISNIIATKNIADIIMVILMIPVVTFIIIFVYVIFYTTGKINGVDEIHKMVRETFNEKKERVKPLYNPTFKRFYFFHYGVAFLSIITILMYLSEHNIRQLISAIIYTAGFLIIVLISISNYRKYRHAKIEYDYQTKLELNNGYGVYGVRK